MAHGYEAADEIGRATPVCKDAGRFGSIRSYINFQCSYFRVSTIRIGNLHKKED